MKKALKIIGIVLASLVGLAIVVAVFGNLKGQLPLGTTVDRGGMMDYDMAPQSIGLPGKSTLPMMEESFDSSDAIRSERNMKNAAPAEVSSVPELPVVGKKIIKSGNLSLRVDNAEKAGEKISEVAKNNGGETFSSNFYQGGNKSAKNGTVTVKVPVANFEKAFAEIKEMASLVIRESTSGSDVTEQYVDLQAQLKNKQVEEQAFVRIMDQATKIQDILDVQRELSRVRGQVEQLQGKLKYLDSQTDMSTITVSLSEDAVISITDKWRPWQVAKESVSVLIKKVQNFVDFVIQLVILVLPVLLLYGLLLWVIYKIGKKIYFRIRKKNPAEILENKQ